MLEDNDFDGFGISKIGVYSLKDIKGKVIKVVTGSVQV